MTLLQPFSLKFISRYVIVISGRRAARFIGWSDSVPDVIGMALDGPFLLKVGFPG